ncbi:hypothetical protein GCM10007989_14100 [Devosia pacifica]|uniref:DUF3800 domain-containing protein n=1 Tax=Devosia pacifica TaxID=1335967 RepID=A0A918VSW2_9HYPH|nr:hypothetical protein [Devosia pacifica]GHA19675.1 hypothetical protein GCM10007989_14100 [Devosia pacifica]
MDLSAYFDDSGSDTGKRDLVFAGLVNRDDAWEQFSLEWSAALARPPAILHLKMVEANGLRGQFAGWSRDDRDQKLQDLAEILTRFRPPWTFDISISRTEYEKHVSPATPRGLSTPHFAATFGAVSGVVRHLASERIVTPVRFVFDEQNGVNQDVALFFDYMLENLDSVSRGLIKMPIGYGDDMRDLPLQAADMLAWHIRRQSEGITDQVVLRRAEYIRSDTHVTSRVPPEMLVRWGAAFSQVLPILQALKSKGEWQRFRTVAQQAKRGGFRPPHGDDSLNALANIRAAWDKFQDER